MKIVEEKDFREYKKLGMEITHKLEGCVKLIKELNVIKERLKNEGYELSEEQYNEIEEYDDRIDNCLNFLNRY